MSNNKLLFKSFPVNIYKRKKVFMNSLYWNNHDSELSIELLLKKDRIVIASTDTVLGLIGQLSVEVFQRLNQIKGRPFDQPHLILVDSIDKIKKMVHPDQHDLVDSMAVHWPNPLTVIFKACPELPSFLKTKEGTIAVRIPDHNGLLRLLYHFDGLFSTSANKHKEPIPLIVDDLDPIIIDSCDALIEQDDATEYPSIPSTIIDCSSGVTRLVREGAYKVDFLL